MASLYLSDSGVILGVAATWVLASPCSWLTAHARKARRKDLSVTS